MSELFEKSIRTLELPRVLQLLADQAGSQEGKRRALNLRPETEAEEVERLQDQTEAAREMIGLRGSPSFSGARPVAEALDRAELQSLRFRPFHILQIFGREPRPLSGSHPDRKIPLF